jgi:hypothetical protein
VRIAPRAHRGIGDIIRRQRILAVAQRAARLTGEERVEVPLARRVILDVRLGVEHHLGAGDMPGEVHARDDVERRRRIAGRGDDIERREDVGDDLVALVDGDRGRGTFLVAQPFGPAGIHHRHDLRRQPLAKLPLLRKRGRGEAKRNRANAISATQTPRTLFNNPELSSPRADPDAIRGGEEGTHGKAAHNRMTQRLLRSETDRVTIARHRRSELQNLSVLSLLALPSLVGEGGRRCEAPEAGRGVFEPDANLEIQACLATPPAGPVYASSINRP